ncbi:MAG: NAD(P)H-binding protein [Nitrospiraceae bacterium]|nr:NAD(P)H-binding protein [Nitrospiraceae bacterium]
MFLFLAGATGFIGNNLLPELRRQGIKGRCLLRDIKKAPSCEGFETVEGSLGDMPDNALDGVDTVVHLAGILHEAGGQTFESVHVRGTQNLVNESIKAGVKHFFYQSSIGASLSSASMYQKTKAMAEEAVKDSGLPYTIFRPSLVLGPGDGFTIQMARMISASPIIAVPGDGEARYQPIVVSDWIKCFLSALKDGGRDKTYELGGPEYFSFNELVREYMKAMGVEERKKLFHFPMGLAKAGLSLLSVAKVAGIKNFPPVDREQLQLLTMDNITDIDSVKKQFGFEPETVRGNIRKFIPEDYFTTSTGQLA